MFQFLKLPIPFTGSGSTARVLWGAGQQPRRAQQGAPCNQGSQGTATASLSGTGS